MTEAEAAQQFRVETARALADIKQSLELVSGRVNCALDVHNPLRLPFVASGGLDPQADPSSTLYGVSFDLELLLRGKFATAGHILNAGQNPLRARFTGVDLSVVELEVVPGERFDPSFVYRRLSLLAAPGTGPTSYRLLAQ